MGDFFPWNSVVDIFSSSSYARYLSKVIFSPTHEAPLLHPYGFTPLQRMNLFLTDHHTKFPYATPNAHLGRRFFPRVNPWLVSFSWIPDMFKSKGSKNAKEKKPTTVADSRFSLVENIPTRLAPTHTYNNIYITVVRYIKLSHVVACWFFKFRYCSVLSLRTDLNTNSTEHSNI